MREESLKFVKGKLQHKKSLKNFTDGLSLLHPIVLCIGLKNLCIGLRNLCMVFLRDTLH